MDRVVVERADQKHYRRVRRSPGRRDFVRSHIDCNFDHLGTGRTARCIVGEVDHSCIGAEVAREAAVGPGNHLGMPSTMILRR